MAKYKARPEVVDAIQWDGDNIEAVTEFMAPERPHYMAGFSNADDLIGLGSQVATKGDWIVKDADGAFTCLSPATFEERYEQVGGGQGE